MTFVHSFYSFSLEITNVDRDNFAKIRVKTPRHPYESLERLYARVLAYVNSYRRGLVFTEGMFNSEQPAVWQKDTTGELLAWIEVGSPPLKRLKGALSRSAPAPLSTEYCVYFYSDDQISEFCDHLKGSKSNWVSRISFYRLDPLFIESLLSLERSSSHWTATIVDNSLFLVCDGVERITSIEPFDIWEKFQKRISNSPE